MLCNILVVDDHVLFAEGMVAVFKSMWSDCVVHTLRTPSEALVALQTRSYDFLFLDLLFPAEPAYLTENFLADCRNNNPNLVIIMLSSVLALSQIRHCLKLGVNGFLSKCTSCDELRGAVESRPDQKPLLSADICRLFLEEARLLEQSILTKKELEVLQSIAAGHSVKQSAAMLYLSTYTILAHRRNIMNKLDLHSAAELVKYAFENNLN